MANKWENVDAAIRRMARELVEDPEYRAALHRRLADGKAPRMMRLVLQFADKKARDPRERRRGKPPLTVVMRYLPGDPKGDPLREREQRMIEAKERAEEAARAQQAASAHQAAAGPEDPEDGEPLESVDSPEPGDPPAPPYRSR
jgi:hypothetical protein